MIKQKFRRLQFNPQNRSRVRFASPPSPPSPPTPHMPLPFPYRRINKLIRKLCASIRLRQPPPSLPPFACSTHFCAHCTVFSFLIFRANFACFKFASPLRRGSLSPLPSLLLSFFALVIVIVSGLPLSSRTPPLPSLALAYRVSISLSSNLGCFFFRISQAANDSDNYNYSAAVTRTVNCKRGVPAGVERSAKQPLLPSRVSPLFLAIELVSCSCILYEIVCMSV